MAKIDAAVDKQNGGDARRPDVLGQSRSVNGSGLRRSTYKYLGRT
jgi:hypothetical protein